MQHLPWDLEGPYQNPVGGFAKELQERREDLEHKIMPVLPKSPPSGIKIDRTHSCHMLGLHFGH